MNIDMTSLPCRLKRILLFLLFVNITTIFIWWKLSSLWSDYSFPIFFLKSLCPRIPSKKEFSMNENHDIEWEYSQFTDPQFKWIYSPNYHLWSNKPSKVDWSKMIGLCHRMLASSDDPSDCIINEGKTWTIPYTHNDTSILRLMSNCSRFLDWVPFRTTPDSQSDAKYPLAYVLVGARNAAQTVRLFRMIYQPQNAYCLVYDKNSSEEYKRIIKLLASCFPDGNVAVTPKPEIIGYAYINLLHSELVCLKVLLKMWTRIKWKYVQIVSWNDFPLKTNSELVNIFKILNASQDSALRPLTLSHFAFLPNKPPVPDGLTVYKGSHATSMTKELVEFVFNNPTALKLYDWLSDNWFGEERFWATIIHNIQLNAPGNFPGQCMHFYQFREQQLHKDKNLTQLQQLNLKQWISRYEVWQTDDEECRGEIVNYSCVFGFLDLLELIRRPELVVHKIYEEFEPATNFCLEQWYWYKVRTTAGGIDREYYQNLPSVRYQNMENKEEFVC